MRNQDWNLFRNSRTGIQTQCSDIIATNVSDNIMHIHDKTIGCGKFIINSENTVEVNKQKVGIDVIFAHRIKRTFEAIFPFSHHIFYYLTEIKVDSTLNLEPKFKIYFN